MARIKFARPEALRYMTGRVPLEVRAPHPDQPTEGEKQRKKIMQELAIAGQITSVIGNIMQNPLMGVFEKAFDTGAGDEGDGTGTATVVPGEGEELEGDILGEPTPLPAEEQTKALEEYAAKTLAPEYAEAAPGTLVPGIGEGPPASDLDEPGAPKPFGWDAEAISTMKPADAKSLVAGLTKQSKEDINSASKAFRAEDYDAAIGFAEGTLNRLSMVKSAVESLPPNKRKAAEKTVAAQTMASAIQLANAYSIRGAEGDTERVKVLLDRTKVLYEGLLPGKDFVKLLTDARSDRHPSRDWREIIARGEGTGAALGEWSARSRKAFAGQEAIQAWLSDQALAKKPAEWVPEAAPEAEAAPDAYLAEEARRYGDEIKTTAATIEGVDPHFRGRIRSFAGELLPSPVVPPEAKLAREAAREAAAKGPLADLAPPKEPIPFPQLHKAEKIHDYDLDALRRVDLINDQLVQANRKLVSEGKDPLPELLIKTNPQTGELAIEVPKSTAAAIKKNKKVLGDLKKSAEYLKVRNALVLNPEVAAAVAHASQNKAPAVIPGEDFNQAMLKSMSDAEIFKLGARMQEAAGEAAVSGFSELPDRVREAARLGKLKRQTILTTLRTGYWSTEDVLFLTKHYPLPPGLFGPKAGEMRALYEKRLDDAISAGRRDNKPSAGRENWYARQLLKWKYGPDKSKYDAAVLREKEAKADYWEAKAKDKSGKDGKSKKTTDPSSPKAWEDWAKALKDWGMPGEAGVDDAAIKEEHKVAATALAVAKGKIPRGLAVFGQYAELEGEKLWTKLRDDYANLEKATSGLKTKIQETRTNLLLAIEGKAGASTGDDKEALEALHKTVKGAKVLTKQVGSGHTEFTSDVETIVTAQKELADFTDTMLALRPAHTAAGKAMPAFRKTAVLLSLPASEREGLRVAARSDTLNARNVAYILRNPGAYDPGRFKKFAAKAAKYLTDWRSKDYRSDFATASLELRQLLKKVGKRKDMSKIMNP